MRAKKESGALLKHCLLGEKELLAVANKGSLSLEELEFCLYR